MSDYKTSYVELAKRTPGVLYEPLSRNGNERIAILTMHSDEDYLSWITAPELAKRGYTALNANVMAKEGIIFSQVEKMQSVKAAVQYLRTLPQIEKIILMGHSGGGTLMSAYQAIAENGAAIFQGPEKIMPYPDNDILPPADGIMLLDSNWGNAAMQLFSLDPAIENEQSGVMINDDIDLFNPKNGFDPNGSHYSEAFIKRFQHNQGIRNRCLVDYALNRLMALEEGSARYTDDEPYIIPASAQGFRNNKLYAQDTRLLSHSRTPHLLLHPDGSTSVEIIHTLRNSENPISLSGSFWEGARFLSIKTYLTSYAVRTNEHYGYDETSVYGIEWDSTYNCPVGNVTHIHVPTLVMGMTAGWEFMASETIFEMCAADDKILAYVEGATHKFTPAAPKYGDTVKILHDFINQWLGNGRF